MNEQKFENFMHCDFHLCSIILNHIMNLFSGIFYVLFVNECESLKFPDHVRLPPNLVDVNPRDQAALEDSQRQIVSFLDATIHSMQNSQNAVLRSNQELDAEVQESQARLDSLTKSFHEAHSKLVPLSLLQMKTKSDDFGFDEDLSISDQAIFRKNRGPTSILELAKARAAASEKKFQEAMKRLENDRSFLLQDENMRRARAAQERRHLNLQK